MSPPSPPPGQDLLAAVPLKYTYLARSSREPYIFQTSTGLWEAIPADNKLILSLIPQQAQADYQIIDNFHLLKSHASGSVAEGFTVSDSRANEHLLHIRIDADSHATGVAEHRRLLQLYQKFDFKTILVDRVKFKDLFVSNASHEIKHELKEKLQELASFCNVEILISNRVEHFSFNHNTDSPNEMNNQNIYFYILGDADDTTFAETRLRILLDSSLGLFVDAFEIPLSLIPLVGGMRFGNFKAIAKETGVNLYLPSIVPELYHAPKKHNLDILFLSGLEAQVLLAKKLMLDLKEAAEKHMCYKNIKVLKVKKDAILTNRKNDISGLMYKYGTFIQIPPLGQDDATIHFQACSSELIELAIDDFNLLTNEVYEADIWFHNGEATDEGTLEPLLPVMPDENVKDLLCRISIAANVLIYASCSMGSYKLVGGQEDTIKAIKLFKSSAQQIYGESYKTTIKLNIELGIGYHEFISGKKNGKIAKITNNSAGSLIDFHPLNEYTLIIELQATCFNDFLNSFSQLQQEFPSEVKFYIPESFHRQIIGSGGALIQSIMRKYNVFVKFSNSYDLKSNFKSHVRYDNVIIRCPYKNSSNIPLVKTELNNLLINNENVHFFNTFFKISRNQYRLFNFNKIQEIEKKTSTFIKFPNSEPMDFTTVEVLGTDTNSINATRLMIASLAESYEFRITHNANFAHVINDTHEAFIEKIKVPFKLLYKFEIMTMEKKSPDTGTYHAIILSYLPESELFLEDAITHLTAFLREYEFMIIDRGELSNNDAVINGSAMRYGNVNSGLNNFQQQQQQTMPLQLPYTQQLFQLPTMQPHQAQQPTMVLHSGHVTNGSGHEKKKRHDKRHMRVNGV